MSKHYALGGATVLAICGAGLVRAKRPRAADPKFKLAEIYSIARNPYLYAYPIVSMDATLAPR